jgi:hypothetical protein
MAPITGDGNREGEEMGCGCFLRGRGGGEAARRYRRQKTQQRAV